MTLVKREVVISEPLRVQGRWTGCFKPERGVTPWEWENYNILR